MKNHTQPTIVPIHGVRCFVRACGPDDYRVHREDTGAVVAQDIRRFAAIAKAASALTQPARKAGL